jgi:hypothetical protein
VLVCDLGQVYTKKGVNLASNRVKFLGILYAGFQNRVDGRLEVVPVPTTNQIISVSDIPNNLGIVIKARKILDFDAIIKGRM